MKKFRFLFSISILLFSLFQGFAQTDSLSIDQPNLEERIKQFHADIRVKENGNLIVTESITVYAAELFINHGIYRALPMESNSPKVSKTNFYKVLSVYRGNLEEPYHLDIDSEKFGIYIGDEEMYLPEGTYTYKLTYEIEAQIHSYSDFDEVYWNVTGNYWEFDIENVTAKITLPKSAKAFQTACYTGVLGSKAHDCNSKIIGNSIYFTSKNLKKGEGFTVAAGFPKGFVHQPFFLQHYKMDEFLSPNKVLLALGFVAFCFAFYYFSWKRHGEDPLLDKTIKIDLKSRYSATALQYIKDKGVDSKTLLITIINLSIKGALEIFDNGKKVWADDFKYSIKKGKETVGLSQEETTVLDALFRENDSFELDEKTYLIFDKAKEALEKPLEKQYNLEDYFLSNSKQILVGFIITITALLSYCYIDKGTIFWAVIFGFILLIITTLLFKVIIQSFTKDFGMALLCIFFSIFTGGFCYGLFEAVNLDKSYSVLNLIVLFLIISGFSFYLSIIGKYTKLGAEIKFEIERWKKELLDYKPEESSAISVYEENLPYIFALGIEEEWNSKFATILEKLNYKNNWIKTTGSRSSQFTLRSVTHFSSSYDSFSSSSSSGSSGGGSSGGGGGGGGGGGW